MERLDKQLSDDALDGVNGGADYINVKLEKLKKQFVKACKSGSSTKILEIAGELQARGCYAWAKETAAEYGISYI